MGQCSRPATEHELGTSSSTVQKSTRRVLLHKRVSLQLISCTSYPLHDQVCVHAEVSRESQF